MPIETTYTHLRENRACILNEIVDQQEIVVVRRKGARDVALIPVSELSSLLKTAHLLKSSCNARRLLAALRRSRTGMIQQTSARELRQEILSGP